MDFFTEKELKGLKSDLKASEIALNAEKAQFEKKLIDIYGKEIDAVFNSQKTTEKPNKKSEKEKSKKIYFLKKLFSI